MRDTFISELSNFAEIDPNIILITGDLGFGVLNDYINNFPNQYINAGVAEQNMTGIATGLGLEGKTVFTYSIGNFNTLRCLEQIRNDACYHEVNVNIISVGGGFSYGPLGYSHHATEDIAIIRALPNIQVFTPSDDWEVKQIVKNMVAHEGVSYLRIDKSFAPSTSSLDEVFKAGKARILKEGKDLSLLACGGILDLALKASEYFEKQGINIRVVSVHSINPFDKNIVIDCASNTGGIITLEEHSLSGGLGSLVCETLVKNNILPEKFFSMGLESKFSTIVGTQDYLRDINGIGLESIKQNIRSLLSLDS